MRSLSILGAFATVLHAQPPAAPKPDAPPVLPGVRADGFVQLPNQWSLKPTGKQVEVGAGPVNMALHPSGKWLAVLNAGAGTHEIAVLDAADWTVRSKTILPQTFVGLCFSPDGSAIYASGGEYARVHAFKFADGLLSEERKLMVAQASQRVVLGGLAASADGKSVYAACTVGDQLVEVPAGDGGMKRSVAFDKGAYPYTTLVDGERLLVTLWGGAAVAVLDAKTLAVTQTIPCDPHPTEMALAPDRKTLFVACANSTNVAVLDLEAKRQVRTLNAALHPGAPVGNTPNSLALTPDGQMLFVANADSNNLAAFNVTDLKEVRPLGFIPTGWYPTSVRFDAERKRLYVANGKGSASKPNPLGPQPERRADTTIEQYIARLLVGTASLIELPAPQAMARLTATAKQCSPLREGNAATAEHPAGNPIPAKVGDPSPIKHCVYILKENRTYDQVLGDLKEGNGAPHLCLFGENVTPNHHKLAREFVLLDNFYVDGEVSADGHEWTMGAYASDYVEKTWPINYRGKSLGKLPYPSEGTGGKIAESPGGYFWDRCAEAKLTYRSYGEWIKNGPTPEQPGTAHAKALEGHFDPWYRGFDMAYSDQKRADRFLVELAEFEKKGEFPNFVVMKLPCDHTAGSKRGAWTPTAMVADNDLALGRVVEGLSKSRFWKDMAIFVVEDDAQNGPDHVDCHRSIAFVASPYCKRRAKDSSMYSTASMLRSMGLILGTKPMSQFDAAARPMYGCFQEQPDLTPFVHAPARVDLDARNGALAWGADKAEKMDLTAEDKVDDLLLGEMVWRSVKGTPMPAPVRAAFLTPLPEKDDDD